MELKQYFDAIKKWWWLLVASTAVAAVAGYLGVSRQPRIYQAATTVIVGQGLQSANPNSQDLYISQQLAQTYREMVTRGPILGGAAKALGLPYAPNPQNVNAWLVAGTQLMGVAVRDTDPERARALADAIVQQLILQTPNEIAEDQARRAFVQTQLANLEQSIQGTEAEIVVEQAKLDAANSARAIQQHLANIAALQERLSTYQATYSSLLGSVEGRTNYISVFEPASTPTRPISPNVMMTVAMAAAIGLALAVAGALLIEFLDDTVKTSDDLWRAAQLTTLGTISRAAGNGEKPRLVAAEEPQSHVAEAYRALRTNVRISSVDKPIHTLIVTSPGADEGKSTTAANLAAVEAQAGKSVILVDADLRRAALHKFFSLTSKEGLTNILVQDELSVDGWLQDTGIENLRLLTSGPLPPDPANLLGSQKMHHLIECLEHEADLIIFDTPPTLVSDATVLTLEADAVLLVVDAGRTRRGAIRRSMEDLQRAGADVLGAVLNRVPTKPGKGYYYYA
ncbi:MAG: polysaccharide biosynthesis tyrosine autokinase [Anaerolineae bacterium]|nr:polysaccharide biosynthesis tyrosine autokinase [Anaerolineae bacterium]